MRAEPVELGSGEKIHNCTPSLFGLILSTRCRFSQQYITKGVGAVLITKVNQR